MKIIKSKYRRIQSKMTHLTKSWVKAKEGIAAMEFIMVAPILLSLYFGVIEATMLVSSQRKVSNAASVVSDLIAQMETISKEDIADAMTAGVLIMDIEPEDYDRLSIVVGSFKRDDEDRLYVAGWSRVGNGSGTVMSTEERLNFVDIQRQTAGAVFAGVSYEYEPFTFKFTQGMTIRDTGVTTPRFASRLDFERNADRNNTHSYACSLAQSGTITCS